MSSDSPRESRLWAAYPGRQVFQPVATSSRDGVLSELHIHPAPRDGYTKSGNLVGRNPPLIFSV